MGTTCLVQVDGHAAQRRADHAQEDRGGVKLGQDNPVYVYICVCGR